jgi:hypothetical protein
MTVEELIDILGDLDPDEEIAIGDLKDIFREQTVNGYR